MRIGQYEAVLGLIQSGAFCVNFVFLLFTCWSVCLFPLFTHFLFSQHACVCFIYVGMIFPLCIYIYFLFLYICVCVISFVAYRKGNLECLKSVRILGFFTRVGLYVYFS